MKILSNDLFTNSASRVAPLSPPLLSLLISPLSVAFCCLLAGWLKVPAVIQLWQLLHFPRIYQPVSVRCLPARHVHVLLISCGHTYFNVRDSILFSLLPLLLRHLLAQSLAWPRLHFVVVFAFVPPRRRVERFYFVRFNFYYMPK